MPEKQRKILFYSPNWVGDAVMSLPALKALRSLHEDAEIIVLSTPWVQEVYQMSALADKILSYDRLGELKGICGVFKVSRTIRDLKCSQAFVFPNSWRSAMIPWLAGIPLRVGYAVRGRSIFLTRTLRLLPDYRRHHMINHYLRITTVPHAKSPQSLNTSSKEGLLLSLPQKYLDKIKILTHQFGLETQKNWIGLAPGAHYGDAKCWRPEYFAKVADKIVSEHSSQVLLFGSSQEIPVAREVATKMREKPIILTGKTNLTEAMILLSQCAAFVTNDSGLMHVAAAFGVPLVAIFGSTSPDHTGPHGLKERIQILESTSDCHPCFKRTCPFTHKECMDTIQPDKVLMSIERLLKMWAKRQNEW